MVVVTRRENQMRGRGLWTEDGLNREMCHPWFIILGASEDKSQLRNMGSASANLPISLTDRVVCLVFSVLVNSRTRGRGECNSMTSELHNPRES